MEDNIETPVPTQYTHIIGGPMPGTWMIRIITLVAVLTFFGPTEAQSLARGGRPKPAEIEGYADAYCVTLPTGLRVCKARETSTREWEPRFVIERSGKILHTTDAVLAVYSSTEDFFAYRGNLEKNGKKYLVISDLENVTNGIAIATSRVRVFEEVPGPKFEEKFSFPIHEFGENGNFIYDRRANETFILLTYWTDFDTLDKSRGTGLYLVGKWFRFRRDRLEPVYRKPTLARRYLFGFQKLRGLTRHDSGVPYSWLKSRNTHRFIVLPEIKPSPVETVAGRITQFDDVEFTIKSNSGEERRFKLSILSDFGDLPKKYIFPDMFRGYTPKQFFGDLTGKRVRLETYPAVYGRNESRLWFLDR
ncbi:MAG: hypothetical protein IPJ30_05490 [Acidobacteria bacterium]|nr:hypothetical protein [Acidobacteriota bacterium]